MTTPHAIVAGLVIAVVGFSTGRISKRPPAPAKAEVHEVTKYVDRVVYQDRVVTVAGKDRVIHRVVKVAVAPDGTQTKEVTTDSDTRTQVAQTSETHVDHATAAEHVREVKITTVARPDWRLGALAGLNLDRQPLYGGEVTRRILGPFDAGAVVIRAGGSTWGGLTVGVSW